MPKPTPEFSEAAFSFAVTHQLVNLRVGAFSPPLGKIASKMMIRRDISWKSSVIQDELKSWLKKEEWRTAIDPDGAPLIPTQVSEKRFPVDLAMNVNGVYCFLQFKRSTPVLKSHVRLNESSKIGKTIHLPLYRVHIRGGKGGKSGDRHQWETLKRLQDDLRSVGEAIVRYAAPAFHRLSELTEFHNNGFSSLGKRRTPVVCFRPDAFTLPGDGTHWISFDGITDIGLRCSSEPEEVSDVLPLVDVISNRSQRAPALKDSIGPLRKVLDGIAKDMGLEEPPRSLVNRTILDTFLVSILSEEEPVRRDVISFMFGSRNDDEEIASSADRESDVADFIRKSIDNGDDEMAKSLMSFAIDYCVADYRSRQLLDQPMMVYANPESELHPDRDTGRSQKTKRPKAR